jgi:hypothetical protein
MLHVAVLDDFNECFVAYSEAGLRQQVSEWLLKHSVPVPTDAEWALTLGEDRYDVDLTTPADGWISYYMSESILEA